MCPSEPPDQASLLTHIYAVPQPIILQGGAIIELSATESSFMDRHELMQLIILENIIIALNQKALFCMDATHLSNRTYCEVKSKCSYHMHSFLHSSSYNSLKAIITVLSQYSFHMPYFIHSSSYNPLKAIITVWSQR